MPNQKLSYPEKLQLLSELKEFYMKDFWNIYDDIPEELWRLKWLSIWLIIDILKTFFKWNNIPDEEEIFAVLSYVIDKDFINKIFKDTNEIEQKYIKSWFWCGIGILKWDKITIKGERRELEKACWIEIKTSLM